MIQNQRREIYDTGYEDQTKTDLHKNCWDAKHTAYTEICLAKEESRVGRVGRFVLSVQLEERWKWNKYDDYSVTIYDVFWEYKINSSINSIKLIAYFTFSCFWWKSTFKAQFVWRTISEYIKFEQKLIRSSVWLWYILHCLHHIHTYFFCSRVKQRITGWGWSFTFITFS